MNVHCPDVGSLYEDMWNHSLADDELRSARLVLLIYYCRCLVAHADTAGEAAEGLEGAVDDSGRDGFREGDWWEKLRTQRTPRGRSRPRSPPCAAFR